MALEFHDTLKNHSEIPALKKKSAESFESLCDADQLRFLMIQSGVTLGVLMPDLQECEPK